MSCIYTYPESRPDTTTLKKFFKNLKKNPRTQSTQPKPIEPDPSGPIIIKMQDGPCGSRKTTGILQRCISIAYLEGYPLLGQQTKILIGETLKTKMVLDWGGKTAEIHSEGAARRLTKRFSSEAGYEPPAGEFTLTTEAAIFALRPFPGQRNIDLFLDEIPTAVKHIPLKISINQHIWTQYIRIKKIGEKWSEIECTDKEAFLDQLKNRRNDFIAEGFAESHWTLVSDDCWTAFVSNKQLGRFGLLDQGDEVQEGDVDAPEDEKVRGLDLFAVLKPEIFKRWRSTTVAGANFKHSLFYLILPSLGVEFEDAGIKLHYDKPRTAIGFGSSFS